MHAPALLYKRTELSCAAEVRVSRFAGLEFRGFDVLWVWRFAGLAFCGFDVLRVWRFVSSGRRPMVPAAALTPYCGVTGQGRRSRQPDIMIIRRRAIDSSSEPRGRMGGGERVSRGHVTSLVAAPRLTQGASRLTRGASRLTRGVTRLTQRVTRLTQRVTRLTQRVTRLTQGVTRLARGVTRLARGVTRHGTTRREFRVRR